MSSDLQPQGLYQQLHARRVSGEDLEVLGKDASASFLSGNYKNLSDAVVAKVKQAQLSPEQVQRVVEFANTTTFQETFRKEGAGHKVVEFSGGPADPARILQDLNDGGGGTVFDRGTADYDHPPSRKHAADERAEKALTEAFAPSGEQYGYAEPLSDAYDMQNKLASAQETLTSQLSSLENMYGDLLERVYSNVKQAALEGLPLGDVLHAWHTVESATPDHVKIAFQYVAPRLMSDGVFAHGEALKSSIEKVASIRRIVNTKHALVVDFDEYCQTLSKMAELRSTREEITTGLGHIDAFLKAASTEGLIKNVYDHSGKAGRVAGEGAEWAARHLLGGVKGDPKSSAHTIGRVVGKAVEHIPTAGALIAGNEVRRQLKYSPTAQAVKNTTLSVVPGTPQYQQREYQIAAANAGPGGHGYY